MRSDCLIAGEVLFFMTLLNLTYLISIDKYKIISLPVEPKSMGHEIGT